MKSNVSKFLCFALLNFYFYLVAYASFRIHFYLQGSSKDLFTKCEAQRKTIVHEFC